MNLPPLFGREFPSYERECYDNRVDVLWYQPAFSQSQYPPGQEGSEACTLICLLVAQGISQNEIILWDVDDYWDLSVVIAQAIAEGNRTHAWIMRQGLVAYAYLNTEEALKYGGSSLKLLREWTFHVYHEDIRERLFQNIQFHLRIWYEQPKSENLFMLLIASGRTILFTFQEKTFKVEFVSEKTTVNHRQVLTIYGLSANGICDTY
ncbi:uncharacterized protein LOC105689813 isoform X2 [Athalia rosae]|uniref:uncharacterized protein LOC105689813 isoform X2 n=1 Tax=Athalia rosae TaxID=37344 RepID=UPI0006255E27|nr:uncharacterized protein LOC105689813 isoform X2 [Athalia rosae]